MATVAKVARCEDKGELGPYSARFRSAAEHATENLGYMHVEAAVEETIKSKGVLDRVLL